MAKGRKSLTEAADKELKTAFSLDKFKANKGLASNVKFKPQRWIPFSPALQEALSIPAGRNGGGLGCNTLRRDFPGRALCNQRRGCVPRVHHDAW